MGRPAVFPLPDDQAKRIIAAVEDLAPELPGGQGSRPFLAAFIERVHAITGQVYGHTTYRKMLDLYAPAYRPSTDTIQGEIRAYRARIETSRPAASVMAAGHGWRPAPAAEPSRPRRVALVPLSVESASALELSRLQTIENDRLRDQLADAQGRLMHAEALAARVTAEIAAERARADTLQVLIGQLQAEREEFRRSIERLQQHADAARRDALLRIDQLRMETREAQAENKALHTQLEQAHKDLRAEREFSSHLRLQLGERARQERSK